MKKKHLTCGLTLGLLLLAAGVAEAQPAFFSSIPEASSYTMVYTLPIPGNQDYNNSLPPYSVDNSANIDCFDRVAYALELDNQWVWVSMDAFTSVPAQVGPRGRLASRDTTRLTKE